MAQKKIKAVIIEPDRIPMPIEIDDDIVALNRAVNIDWRGRPHREFESFEIFEIKDDINIISSPKGEEPSLPVTRTIGQYLKFYGIIYIVKMRGYNLVSMTDREVIEYCMKFMDKHIPMEEFGYPTKDYDDGYTGRVEISFDEW